MFKTALWIISALMLIMDSKTAAISAGNALQMCIRTLIPNLFPLLVISAMVVPGLKGIRLPGLSRLLHFPDGSEGLFLLGCAGGFPVGAACVAQSVQSGSLTKADGARMLGLVSFCGPGFLFGVIGQMIGLPEALAIFLIQLESGILLASVSSSDPESTFRAPSEDVTLPSAVRRAITSMATVCAWVILASVATGFAQRWVFPLLPETVGILLTGLLELTNGVFSVHGQSPEIQFLFCTIFACFGGISVLLQISSLTAPAGLGMGVYLWQKMVQALIAGILAAAYLQFGWSALLLPFFVKIAVDFPRSMVYNVRRKEGI